jgi:hypothetical protein
MCAAFELCILGILPCLQCEDLACSVHTSGRYRDRQPSSVSKVRQWLPLPLDMSDIILSLGFLFFGTITHVEDTIRSVIEGPSWQQRPVQFLVLDMSLVGGIDMSSAEAFVRIHRLLSARCVALIFCGFEADSPIGKALSSVEVVGQPGVELFSTFSDAMECERIPWYCNQKQTMFNFLTLKGRKTHTYMHGSSPKRSRCPPHFVSGSGVCFSYTTIY